MRRFAVVTLATLVLAGFAQRRPANPLTLEAVILAADRLQEAVSSGFPVDAADWAIVAAGLEADTKIKIAAVRGIGRLERPDQAPRIAALLTDDSADVRLEAASAIVQALWTSSGAAVRNGPDIRIAATADNTTPHGRDRPDPRVPMWKLMPLLGEFHYDGDRAVAVEEMITGLRRGTRLLPGQVQPVSVPQAEALDALLRLVPGHEIQQATRLILRQASRPEFGPNPRAPILAALEALQLARDNDVDTLLSAGTYRCVGASSECGWEARRLAVQMMNPGIPKLDAALDVALHDVVFQVRIDALTARASSVRNTHVCAPLMVAFLDAVPAVALRAAELMSPPCVEPADDTIFVLKMLVQGGGSAATTARALMALARFAPAEARQMAETLTGGTPVVRAAVARVAGVAQDEALALAFAADTDPNVAAEALRALQIMGSPARAQAAIDALFRDDHQLIRTAAAVLAGTTSREPAIAALTDALARVTAAAKDTSRDARLGLIDSLRALSASDPALAASLQPYLADFDPRVAAAAADLIGTLTGLRPEPKPRHRPAQQPTEAQLRAFLATPARSRTVTLQLDNGSRIGIALDVDDAPLTCYRFASLARAGYYNGLTFHHVVQNGYVQGGSPNANNESGDARFLRDEISLARHTAGAVGLTARGRDAGDAGFFIDLVDMPSLNRVLTVFGNVVPGTKSNEGMNAAHRITEGTRISSITVGWRIP